MAWRAFSHPDFPLHFQYPDPTPQGYAVEAKEGRVEPAATRIHLTSPGSQELYFELTRYPERSPEAAYEQFRQGLVRQFEEVAIGRLEATTLAYQPALTFTFRWPAGIRTVFFVPQNDSLYRIVYNPDSPLNAQVLSTLSFSNAILA